jgi:hypothetical protein
MIPPELSDYIVSTYVAMRSEEDHHGSSYFFTTARTLIGILRLAIALVCPQCSLLMNQARLRLSDAVAQMDVDEGIRLMRASKASLFEDGTDVPAYVHGRLRLTPCSEQQDPLTRMYGVLRNMVSASGTSLIRLRRYSFD